MKAVNVDRASEKKNIIIWAVDVTENPLEAKKVIVELKLWASQLNCDVLPVSIFPKSILRMPVDYIQPWRKSLEKMASSTVEKFMKKNQVTEFLPTKLIFISSISKRKMATELAKYAERQKAILIMLKTGLHKTWNPFRLGSFAEKLVNISRVPVLLLNSQAVVTKKISTILFPTDFSKESKNAFLRLLPWAKSLNAKVLIFNQVERPIMFYSEFSEMSQPQNFNIEAIIDSTEQYRINQANEWAKILNAHNIKHSTIVKREKKYISKEVIELAKKNNVSLIAMASHSGPAAQVILGSIVRDVLLQARCPVLVFYKPKAPKVKKNKETLLASPQPPDIKYLPEVHYG